MEESKEQVKFVHLFSPCVQLVYVTLSQGELQPRWRTLQYILNHSEYVSPYNIEWGFHGEPARKKHYKLQQDILSASAFNTKR